MIERLREKITGFLRRPDYLRVVTNFLSLSVLQGANLILPLITFPYLVRVLGLEYFGLINFAMATLMYFETLTDYGFDLSATHQVSVNRKDPEKLRSIYSSVLTVKAMLAAASLAVLAILVYTVPKFSAYHLIYFVTFGRLIGKSLFPVWFFQGMERMVITTYLNLISKFVFTIAIFMFIHEPGDYLLAAGFNAMGFILPGVLATIQVRFGFGIRYKLPSMEEVREQFRDGWHVFVSRIFVNLYTTTNVFLLGLFTENLVVGYYAVASKIVEAISSLFIPANNALFPYMSKLFRESKERFYQLVGKLNMAYLAIGGLMMAAAMIAGKQLIQLVNGSFDQQVHLLFLILSVKVVLAPFAPFFTNIWINQERKRQYLGIVRDTFIANMILIPPAIWFFGATGMAVVVVVINFFHLWLFIRQRIRPELIVATA
ncbi:MAG: oligosaccharide flippase family protein [Bacteroidota bacterium]